MKRKPTKPDQKERTELRQKEPTALSVGLHENPLKYKKILNDPEKENFENLKADLTNKGKLKTYGMEKLKDLFDPTLDNDERSDALEYFLEYYELKAHDFQQLPGYGQKKETYTNTLKLFFSPKPDGPQRTRNEILDKAQTNEYKKLRTEMQENFDKYFSLKERYK